MLTLGGTHTIKHDGSGIELDIAYLTTSKHREFYDQCIKQEQKDGKLVTTEVDMLKFAKLCATHSVKTWRNIIDANGNAIEFTSARIDELMEISPIREWFLAQMSALEIIIKKEVAEAKND